MEKELCFNIEGKELYLEHTLVDYNDIPIFFYAETMKNIMRRFARILRY